MKKTGMRILGAALAFSLIAGIAPAADLTAHAERTTSLGIDYDCGDSTFFSSDYLSDIGDKYYNCIIADKGNKVICNRLAQRYNKDRTDNSIYMEKTNSSDCHIDVSLASKRFPYVLIRSDVKLYKTGTLMHLAYIRDTATLGKNVDAALLNIEANGELKAGNTSLGAAPESFSYALGINLENNTYDVYINNVKKCSAVSLSKNMKFVSLARFWIREGSGSGAIGFSSLEVIGMRKPYTGSETNYSSVFASDEKIKEYLSDKTAFHAYSGAYSLGGEKKSFSKPPKYDEENKILYMFPENLKEAYNKELSRSGETLSGDGITLSVNSRAAKVGEKSVTLENPPIEIDGEIGVSLVDFAGRILGLKTFSDGFGLFITSQSEINLDLENETPEYEMPFKEDYPWSDIKSINRYMFFERPTAQKIKSIYKSFSGYRQIIASEEEFDAVRKRCKTDAVFNSFCQTLISRADGFLSDVPPEYSIPDKQRITGISQEMANKMGYFGFAYQITGDEKYARAAYRFLEKAASYPDWNPSHMIDIGEMNVAFAIGYSWMRSAFSQSERQTIYNAAKKMGMMPTYLAYFGRLGGGAQYADRSDRFVLWKSNFNGIINSGAICTALAFMEFDEDFCADMLEKALRSLEFTFAGITPDGGWIESPSYWDYMFTILTKGLSSLTAALGTDFGLLKYQGLNKTVQWRTGFWAYQGTYNFHDCPQGRSYTIAPAFFGKAYGSDMMYAARKQQLDYSGNNVSEVYDALWYSGDSAASLNDLPHSFSSKGTESFVMRSSYTQMGNTTLLAAHGGPVFAYHSHADAGSFVFDSKGKRWACDLGGEDYNVQRDGSEGFYSSYRRRAEAHNVIVINPNTDSSDGGQLDNAFVPLVDFKSGTQGSQAVYDMTDAYGSYVSDYKRSFFMDSDEESVIVQDRLSLKAESEVNWFMTTDADVLECGNGLIRLKKENSILYIKYKTNASEATAEITDCKPLLGEPSLAGQNENSDYRRIRIKLRASGDTYISVSLSTNSAYEKFDFSVPLAEYNFSGFSGNDISDIKDSESKATAVAYHTPEALVYSSESGVFGRQETDQSLHLWNREEKSDYPDLYQFVEYPLQSCGKISEGESAEVSFYMAYDGSKAGKYVEAFINTDDVPSGDKKSGTPLFSMGEDGSVRVWGNRVNNFFAKKKRWYKFSICSSGGNIAAGKPNMYYFYIDDKLAASGSFVPTWRKETKNAFRGFEKLWIGQQIPESEVISEKTYKTSHLYLDDLRLFTYGKGIMPNYSQHSLSHSDYDINAGIVSGAALNFYAAKGTTVKEILGGISSDGAKISFAGDMGESEITQSTPIDNLYMRLEYADKTPLYLNFITDSKICYEYFGGSEPDNTLPSGLSTSLMDFTHITYPSGQGGRESGDSHLKIETSGYNGSASGYNHFVQYTFPYLAEKLAPVHIGMSLCGENLPSGSNINLFLIYVDKAGGKQWIKYATVGENREVKGLNGEKLFDMQKGRWYNIELTFYPDKLTADISVNKEAVLKNIDVSCKNGFGYIERFKIEQTVENGANQAEKAGFMIDDFKVYCEAPQRGGSFSELVPEFSENEVIVDAKNNVVYNIPGDKNIAEIINCGDALWRICKGADEAAENVLVLERNGVLRYYDISGEKLKLCVLKELNLKRENNKRVLVSYTADCKKYNLPIKIVVAQYKGGTLISTQIKTVTLNQSDGSLGSVMPEITEVTGTQRFAAALAEDVKVKAFALYDLESLTPLFSAAPEID